MCRATRSHQLLTCQPPYPPADAGNGQASSCDDRRKRTRYRACMSFIALATTATTASAQAKLEYNGARTDPRRVEPVLLSISGGISLGAYQAGMNWALLQIYRTATANPNFAARFKIPQVELGSIAGASAGNINTLLWAIEACRKPTPQPPDSSLFWKVWTSVGLTQLMPRGLRADSSERAIFDRSFFRDSLFPRLDEAMRSPDLQSNCELRLGVTLTRLRPDTLAIGDLPVLTQRFATAVTAKVIAGGPSGLEMKFAWPDSIVQGNRRFGKLAFPPRDSAGFVPTARMYRIVQAGSAFPVAFQPETLTLVHPRPGRSDTTRTDVYLDGGVFDNNPLGLAIDLFANANPRGVLTDRDTTQVNVIYVTPGRYRGQLEESRLRRESVLASGGVMSALQLLGGAVETAQQYELQFAAREPSIKAPDTVALRLTSRRHPIIGEHLAHFGAFLARPFREYDFFVGVYDALYFVASEYSCPKRPKGQRNLPCVGPVMADLIGRGGLPLGKVAPPLLNTLFASEFSDTMSLSKPDTTSFLAERRMLASMIRWGETLDDTSATNVLLALHAALQKTQLTRNPGPCGNEPLPHLIMCSDRLRDFLIEFRETKGVARTIKRWRQSCRTGSQKLAKAMRARACESAGELNELVLHPNRYAANTTDRLLERLWDVEHRVHRDFKKIKKANQAAARPDSALLALERLDAEVQTGILLAQYRSRPLRPRYGFEWSTTSAPPRAKFAHYAVPYYIGFNVGDSGFELGYQPTWHIGREFGIMFPITSHWTTPVTQQADGVLIGEGKDWYAGTGLGTVFTGVIPRPIGLFLPEFGLTSQFFVPTLGTWAGNGRLITDAYADISLLAGRLRVAVRNTSRKDQFFDGSRWAWSLGIADLNGLAYWLARLHR